MALRTLQNDPRIVPKRIGITGYSFGGIVSLNVIENKLKKPIVGDSQGFAASMPVYGSCQSTWQNLSLTGAPLYILSGEKDDYTWASYCVDYAERLKKSGYDVRIKVYPGAHHNWIDLDNQGSKVRCDGCWHFNECGPGSITDEGDEVGLDGTISTKNGWRSFISTLVKKCGKKGVTIKYQKEAHDDTLMMNVEFFSEILKK